MADTKISALNALGAPAIADLFVVVDDSATETKKITYQGLMDGISNLSELLGSTVVFGDRVVVYDTSAGDAKYMDLDEFFEAIYKLTTAATPLEAADYVLIYDDSASAARKIAITDFFTDTSDIIPKCRAYNSAVQSLSDSTHTAITFNSEEYDTENIHSTSSNTSRFTIQTAGTYHFIGSLGFAANATGYRQVSLKVNDTTDHEAVRVSPLGGSNPDFIQVSSHLELSASDYVELIAIQDSGGALDTYYLSNRTPVLSCVRVAD